MKKMLILAGVLSLIAAGPGPASADKCNGAKVKAIGKKESGLLGCSGKEATKGTAAVQPTCNDKVSGKFVAKYDKPTGCVPAAPSDSTCETAADACQSAIRAALPDGDDVNPSKCEAARLKAAGKLASGELGCISKAAAKSLPVDPACITKATGKFTAAFNKVSGCTGDGNASGIQGQVESSCVDPIVAVSGGNFVSIVCGGGPTTTTSVTTTTSTTNTTFPGPCCGMAPTKLLFTTGIGTGNCGTVLLSNGSVQKNLACSGLYTGGGANTVPLPTAIPDQEQFLSGTTSCNNSTGDLTLTNLTSAQTGSNRNCTSVGCLFGAPLPIPNAATTPTSVCVINIVATDGSGGANCLSGAVHLNLPLTSELYLDGDLFPNAPGIQVCPVCNRTCNAGSNLNGPCNSDADCPGGGAGSCAGSNKCHGGPNDGTGCMPADSPTLGTTNSFPTSLDCPPPPANDIGGLPIAFDLVTGTKTATAQNLGSGQPNVFCGFCRDVTGAGTGCFAGDPNPSCPTPNPASPIACTSNAQCPAAYPDCQQRNGGAFGPAAIGAHTITETGTPAGDMTDALAHASTLASIFCIPPTFTATVDVVGDLPGPGAVTLSGTAQLLP
jgi:hypothetical protein